MMSVATTSLLSHMGLVSTSALAAATLVTLCTIIRQHHGVMRHTCTQAFAWSSSFACQSCRIRAHTLTARAARASSRGLNAAFGWRAQTTTGTRLPTELHTRPTMHLPDTSVRATKAQLESVNTRHDCCGVHIAMAPIPQGKKQKAEIVYNIVRVKAKCTVQHVLLAARFASTKRYWRGASVAVLACARKWKGEIGAQDSVGYQIVT
jgi:hypothetical protein